MNKSTMIASGVLAILLVAGFWYIDQGEKKPAAATSTAPALVDYTDAEYGLAFAYPESYLLTQEDDASASQWALHYISLMRKVDLPPPVNGEGPPSISVAFFTNKLDKKTLVQWLKTDTLHSNFNTSNGTYASTTVDGREAITYKWSGLYEGVTTAFLYKDTVVSVTVEYLTPGDEIVDAYKKVLDSVQLP
ncbi:MAG: hypothetical protein JWN18_110 [Parcubacteria group bacterium]|nr:hypothetical protein [Parcubacteria group bacterium]